MPNIAILRIGLGLAILCLLLLFVGGPAADMSRFIKNLWDLGHIFCFALWTWLYLQLRPRAGFWRQFFLLVALTLAIGGATELIQARWLVDAGREGSWLDLQKDLNGCLLVLMFLHSGRMQLNSKLRHGLQLLVLIGTFLSLLPLMKIAADDLLALHGFPLLSGFEHALEVERWEGNSQLEISDDPVYRGQAALQVLLNTDQYSGVTLRYFPADWSGYKYLNLEVYNPEVEPLELNLRVNDQRHRQFKNVFSDRFNTLFVLGKGWTTLTVSLDEVSNAPTTRRMEMTEISGMQLFVEKLDRPRTLFIDEVRLVR